MEYRMNAGQYVLYAKPALGSDLEPVGKVLDEIALAIDTEDGILHKHGPAEAVCAWHARTAQKLRAAGAGELAEHLVVVTGRFPVDEVNRCIANTTYTGQFYRKLLSREIEAVGWDEPSADEGTRRAPQG